MVTIERLQDVLEQEKMIYTKWYGNRENPAWWDKKGWKRRGMIDALAWCLVFVINQDEKTRLKYLKVRDELRKEMGLKPLSTTPSKEG